VHDRRKLALPPGKRISRSGRVYYEYRRNRSDLYPEEKPPEHPGRSRQQGRRRRRGEARKTLDTGWIWREFNRLLEKASVPRDLVRLEFRRYKNYLGTAVIRRKPPYSIRIDPRVVEVLDLEGVRHILAHEITHVKLHLEGKSPLLNRLHLEGFYDELAGLVGYPSGSVAQDRELRSRAVVEERRGNGCIRRVGDRWFYRTSRMVGTPEMILESAAGVSRLLGVPMLIHFSDRWVPEGFKVLVEVFWKPSLPRASKEYKSWWGLLQGLGGGWWIVALVVSDILPIWRKSGKYLIPLPDELVGVVGHGDVVEVTVIHPDGDRYVLRGVVKVWRKEWEVYSVAC